MTRTSANIARVLVGAGAVLLFVSSLMLASVGHVFVSPDENANAFFAQRFAQTGSLAVSEPLNSIADGRIHPRSMVVVSDRLVPGSFLGLPVLYGTLAAILGAWVLPLLTAVVAAVAVAAWYGIVRRVYGQTIGVVAALLLATHPAWWYYASRGFMHNVLFASLLVFAAYMLVARPLFAHVRRPQSLRLFGDAALAGCFIGMALFVRTSEIVWVLPLCVLVPALVIPRTAWRHGRAQMAAFVVFFGLACVPFFAFNQATYGSPFETGYTVMTDSQRAIVATEGVVEALEVVGGKTETSFGSLDWSATKTNTKLYLLGLFWWLSLLCLVGVPHVLPQKMETSIQIRNKRAYVFTMLFAAAILVPMYGSWVFFDNPDPSQVTIGNSHIRYWLPLFLLSTPIAASGIVWIAHRVSSRRLRTAIIAIMVFLCAIASVQVAALGPQDGLVVAREGLENSRVIRSQTLDVIEDNAVIIVDRADKLFFPYRDVLYPLRDEATYALMPKLVRRVPLYYYGITLPPQDIGYLNEEKLAAKGLRIDLVRAFDIESLYRITPASGEGL